MAMKRLTDNANVITEDIAGNAAFSLTTVNDDGSNCVLKGILKEMPSFGLSTEWTDAPKNTFGKKLQEFFMNDMIETASTVLGATYNSQLMIDDWSTRMYSGTKNKGINLSFRIYPQNMLGQTDPTEWLQYLSLYATPSGKSVTNINTLFENIGNMLKAAEENGEKAGELLNLITGTKNDPNSEKEKEKRQNKISDVIWKMPLFLENAKRNVREKLIETNMVNGKPQTFTDTFTDKEFIGPDKLEQRTYTIDQIIDLCKIELTFWSTSMYNEKKDPKDVDLDDKHPIKFDFTWPRKTLGKSDVCSYSNEKVGGDLLDTENVSLNVDNIMNGLNSDSDWDNNGENVLCATQVRDYFEKVMININDQITAQHDNNNGVDEVNKDVIDNVVKNIENEMVSQFRDEDRYKQKFLASRLWQLRMFPFIFKKPIIVAITDWKVTPSLEMMDGRHAYYDFTISCEPDQVKSLERWQQVIKS